MNLNLSIIVPAYNVSNYLERCLQSLLDQNISKEAYEIIIVNDGSKDDTQLVAEKFIAKHHSYIIHLINQENKGLAGARNTGIRFAKGTYLMFVDSDDYIEPNVLAEMLDFAVSNSLEIAMFGQTIIVNGVKKHRQNKNKGTSSVMMGIELFFQRHGESACKYLIESNYLKSNDLYFFEKAIYLEDGEWSPRLFAKAQKTAYKNLFFYNYELRPGSLVTSGVALTEKAILGYMQSAHHLKKFKERTDLTLEQSQFINQTIAKFVLLPITLCASFKGFKQIMMVRKIIFNSGFNKLEIVGLREERLKQAKLFNKSFFMLFLYLLKKNFLASRSKDKPNALQTT